MKRTIPVVALMIILILLLGLSCSQREAGMPGLSAQPVSVEQTELPASTIPQDWKPPVFPGAVLDDQIQEDLTAVAKTPDAIDETACECFGFPVHNAVFHAYHSDANAQDVMDFYLKQMAAEGWKRIATQSTDSVLLRRAWQQGTSGPLVVYLMVAPLEEGKTLIYLSIAESDSTQKILEEQSP